MDLRILYDILISGWPWFLFGVISIIAGYLFQKFVVHRLQVMSEKTYHIFDDIISDVLEHVVRLGKIYTFLPIFVTRGFASNGEIHGAINLAYQIVFGFFHNLRCCSSSEGGF